MKRKTFTGLSLAVACLIPFVAWSGAGEENASLTLARQLNQTFVEIARKVSPTVVVINVVQKASHNEFGDDEEGSFEAMPPELRRFHERMRRLEPSVGQGSGIIVRENGYILTNRHVVEDADSIEVRLQDGRTFVGAVRGEDRQSDIAVVKIDAQGLPVGTLADSSKVQVGEFAIAIGAPYSLDYSVTFGHVSAKGRSHVLDGLEGAAMDQDFIQTDALINPGNSGGPLINLDGQVTGVITLIRGLHTGIGFAVPSSLAKEVSDALIADGKFTRAWLGISIQALRDDSELRKLVKAVQEGVVVTTILPDGPAAKSELKPSDIIATVDGLPVTTAQELRNSIRNKKVGQPITLDVCRNDKIMQVKVVPGEWVQPKATVAKVRTAPALGRSPLPGLGFEVEAVTLQLAEKFDLHSMNGVLVTSVEKNSPAGRKGVKPGDLVTSIDQQPVSTPKQFQAALQKADLKKGVLVSLLSGRIAHFVILKIGS